jgi:hypothetical protein
MMILKKVKFLRLIKHQAMIRYKGVNIWVHAFLTLKLDVGVWSAPRPGSLNPRCWSRV